VRTRIAGLLVPVLALATGLGAAAASPASGQARSVGNPGEGVPAFGHVFLIIGENTTYSHLKTTNAPFLMGVIRPHAAWLSNYYAATHWSQANYVALVTGQFTRCEQKDGGTSCHQNVGNLFQDLATAGDTFTTWPESMPAPCFLVNAGEDATQNHYAAKHNPQLFFDNVEGDALGGSWLNNGSNQGGAFCRATNIPAGSASVPNDMSVFNNALAGAPGAPAISGFNLVVPNECEDAHDNCKPPGNPITQFDDFLAREVPLIQNYINTHGGLLIVTFDEGITNSPVRAVKFGNGGNVAFAAWGPQVHPAVYAGGPFTHYSFLRTLQDGFGLIPPTFSYLAGAGNPATMPINQIWN
jgi:phosphatidylinositol-3-phosphatase